MCSRCCKLGSIAKQFCKLESDCERLMSEWLASTCIADNRKELIRTLRAEDEKLQTRLECVEEHL